MKFVSLNVSTPCWGENRGQILAVLEVEGKESKMQIRLSPSAGEKLIAFCAEMLAESAREAAGTFAKELKDSIGPRPVAITEGGESNV